MTHIFAHLRPPAHDRQDCAPSDRVARDRPTQPLHHRPLPAARRGGDAAPTVHGDRDIIASSPKPPPPPPLPLLQHKVVMNARHRQKRARRQREQEPRARTWAQAACSPMDSCCTLPHGLELRAPSACWTPPAAANAPSTQSSSTVAAEVRPPQSPPPPARPTQTPAPTREPPPAAYHLRHLPHTPIAIAATPPLQPLCPSTH